jgi:uncharacterized integral membrane protein
MKSWKNIFNNNCESSINESLCIQNKNCHINKTIIVIGICIILLVILLVFKIIVDETQINNNKMKFNIPILIFLTSIVIII